MASAWLSGAYGSVEGLIVPGRPDWAATLVLAAEGVQLRVGDVRPLLPWSELDHSWSFAAWASSQYAQRGVALHVSSASVALVASVVAAMRARTRLAYLARARLAGGSAVPLYAPRRASAQVQKEIDTVRNLCRVVADWPQLRARLHEADRTNTLLDELRAGAKYRVEGPLHLRRHSVEIRTAMSALGLVHRYGGRPIPDGVTSAWTRERAADAVLAYVASNKFAAGVVVSRNDALAALDKEYFSIEPWPFAALFK